MTTIKEKIEKALLEGVGDEEWNRLTIEWDALKEKSESKTKVLGSGKKGCVFSPPAPSTGLKYQSEKYVMKVTDNEESSHELNVASVLRCIDPRGEFLAYPIPRAFIVDISEIPAPCLPFVTMSSRGGLILPYAGTPMSNSKQVADFYVGLLPALDRLKMVGVAHLDIHPPNILVDDQKKPRIIDFGTAIINDYYNKLLDWISLLDSPLVLVSIFNSLALAVVVVKFLLVVDGSTTEKDLKEKLLKEYGPYLKWFQNEDLLDKWMALDIKTFWSTVLEPNFFKLDLFRLSMLAFQNTDITGDLKTWVVRCLNPDITKVPSVEEVILGLRDSKMLSEKDILTLKSQVEFHGAYDKLFSTELNAPPLE